MKWTESSVRPHSLSFSSLTTFSNYNMTGILQGLLEKSEIKIKPLLSAQQYGVSRTQQEIDHLELTLNELVTKLNQMNESYDTLHKRYLELTELRHVLRETAVFFEEAESKSETVFGILFELVCGSF